MSLLIQKINDNYSLKGTSFPVEQPKAYLVAITGMDEHSERYEYFATKLNEKGINVDFFDHFGQGQNANSVEEQQIWPSNAWNNTMLALKLKIDEYKKTGLPVYLMGHSMGSILVQNFILKYPHAVDKVVNMGGVGPRPSTYKFAHFICSLFYTKKKDKKESKFMTKLLLGSNNKKIKNPKTEFDWLSHNQENVQNYINDPYCGHYNTWGFYKEFTYGLSQINKKKNLKRLSPDENILIVAGEDDPVGCYSKGPLALAKMYQKYGVKKVKCIIYPNMRHEILNEIDKDTVIRDILDFLTL